MQEEGYRQDVPSEEAPSAPEPPHEGDQPKQLHPSGGVEHMYPADMPYPAPSARAEEAPSDKSIMLVVEGVILPEMSTTLVNTLQARRGYACGKHDFRSEISYLHTACAYSLYVIPPPPRGLLADARVGTASAVEQIMRSIQVPSDCKLWHFFVLFCHFQLWLQHSSLDRAL